MTAAAWARLRRAAAAAVAARRREGGGAAGDGRHINPLRMPQRETAAGVRICRFHNYSEEGCARHRDPDAHCGYGHAHCHACGASGGHVDALAASLPLHERLLREERQQAAAGDDGGGGSGGDDEATTAGDAAS